MTALALGLLTLRLGASDEPWCPLDWVNLAFHEAGHVVFRPFGSTLGILGGTLLQLVVPAGLAVGFVFKYRSPIAAAACTWWLGESLLNVARYMADARDLALPLVGGGEHDWNELFFRFGLLGRDSVSAVSGGTRAIAVASMLAGAGWCAALALRGAPSVASSRPR